MALCIILFLPLLLFNQIDSARILVVVPTPSISHQIVFRPLTQELAKRGHEVIVVTTDPAFSKQEAPANLTEIDVHDISYQLWKENFYAKVTGKKDALLTQLRALYETTTLAFEEQLKTKEVQELIQAKQHFDLLIIEAWAKSGLILSHIFKAPVIQMSSFGRALFTFEDLGVPTHSMLYPRNVRQRLYNLTLWEKISEMYTEIRLIKLSWDIARFQEDWVVKHFGPDFPSLNELTSNIAMLFMNIHPIWEGNQPVPPSVIYIWGLHRTPEKELPKDLQLFLDSSKNGVIYMSFGTNTHMSNFPEKTIQTFINVFSRLPYDILWKWDMDEPPGRSKNIKIAKWFPQPDLLRHPNLRLFITQGGLQSTDEAINSGVPLIGIPVLGDQWYNTEKYVHHRIGLQLDLETMTERKLQSAIETVIGDQSYKKNIQKLRELMRDEPMPALERAVWWVEQVLRHGGARHLRSPAANISWSQYLELELIALVISVIIVVLVVFLSALYFLLKFLKQVRVKTKVE